MTSPSMTQEDFQFQPIKRICNLDVVSSFLTLLADNGSCTFQTFSDDKNGNDQSLVRVFHGSFDQHKNALVQLNQRGAGVFVTVNETDLKGRKIENIKSIRAVFVDLDGAPLEPILSASLSPHIIVETSPGRYHAYWMIKDLPLEKFSIVQKELIKRFNADPAVHDLARVMRLPGFWHLKGEPFQTTIFEISNQQAFSYEEFITTFNINLCETNSQSGPLLGIDKNPVLKLLQARQMIQGQGSKGQWNILCPWFSEHTTGIKGTCYFEPNTNGYQGHGFKCLHAHCVNRKADDLLEWLGVQSGAKANIEEWDAPTLLPEGLPPVACLEGDMLPEVLRGWIWDIADRMQIPPDFVAAAAIVVLSSLIGRKIGILPKRLDDWLVVPNLWGAIVGRPSLLKSPAIAEIMKPLDLLAADATKVYQSNLERFESEQMVIRACKDACQSKLKKAAQKNHTKESLEKILSEASEFEPSAEPILKRYKSEDATTEKIGEILLQNPNGILIHRDELTGWLKSLDKDGREGDRAFYLEAWNGSGSFTVDRIKRGTLHIPALCLSIIGGIQPGPLSSYVYQTCKGGAGDDGLLQRFQLLVWPDAPKEWENIDRLPDSKAKDRVYDLFKQLDRYESLIDPLALGIEIPALRFSPQGQEIFDSWRANLEKRLRSGDMSPSLESHLGKYRSLLPSLSLIFQLCIDLDKAVEPESIHLEAIQLAIRWCEYLESHAKRLYSSAENHKMESARALLLKIQKKEIADGFTQRDVYGNHWSKLSEVEEVRQAVDVLIMYGWIRPEEVKTTGGRPKQIYRIHPQLNSKRNMET